MMKEQQIFKLSTDIIIWLVTGVMVVDDNLSELFDNKKMKRGLHHYQVLQCSICFIIKWACVMLGD